MAGLQYVGAILVGKEEGLGFTLPTNSCLEAHAASKL